MPLYRIRLELARDKDHPEGSPLRGYEVYAPLTADGHFDKTEWKALPAACTLRRFWDDEEELFGQLIHTASGDWAFSYVADADDDDEPIFKLDRHTLRQGEYITVSGPDHKPHTFRIAAISPVVKPAKTAS